MNAPITRPAGRGVDPGVGRGVSRGVSRGVTLAVAALGSLPFVSLLVRAGMGRLSANPIEDVTHVTGEWALRFLVASLAVTPVRRLTGWAALAPHRRTLGLLAFAYATLHMLTWAVLDQGLDVDAILEDVTERPFVWLGATAFLAMLPLAMTSTRGWMRRLKRRWNTLHRAAYVAGVAAVAHFFWLTKADELEPVIWAAVVSILLLSRLAVRDSSRKTGTGL